MSKAAVPPSSQDRMPVCHGMVCPDASSATADDARAITPNALCSGQVRIGGSILPCVRDKASVDPSRPQVQEALWEVVQAHDSSRPRHSWKALFFPPGHAHVTWRWSFDARFETSTQDARS